MRNLKTLCIAIVALFFVATAHSQKSKPKFSLLKVQIENNLQMKQLISQGFDIDFNSKKDGDLNVIAQKHDLERLDKLGYKFEIIHDDLSKFMQAKLVNPVSKSLEIGQGSMGGYFTYAECVDFIDSIQAEYSSLMSTPISIGQTIEGNEILAYKISDNPQIEENEARCLITGLHHAREPMAIVAPLYFTQWLLENYGTDETATYIVENREIWFVPVLNVDGYLYNEEIEPNGGGMWRKNKRDNDGSGTFDPDNDGVDLNRNYGYGWGFDNNGSSPDPSSETYRGESPFSEPEAEAIRQLCIDKGFKTALNFHTFGDLLIYSEEPDGSVFPDQELFREYGHDVTKDNGYVYGNGSETVQYVTNGDSDAWMYGEQTEKDKIMAFTPEIGTQFDYFWAPSDRIMELAEENLYTQIYMALAAGYYLKIEDYRYDDLVGGDGDLAAEANETVDLIINVRNKGWDFGATNVTAELSCNDANVTINSSTVVADFTASSNEELTFNISLSGLIEAGYTTTIEITFTDANGYNLTESYEIIFGKPYIAFFDNAENGLDLWNAEGDWGITDEQSSDGMYCFTDSPYDTYGPNSNIALTLANPIDLAGLNNAMLSFKTRWNMERDWDMIQLQISTDNGSTWEPLEGEYSSNGAGGDGVQPLNEPVYNGFRDLIWVNELVQLGSYLNEQVLIRFIIETDGGVEEDGWYIDDIKLIAYTDVDIMPEILSVTEYQNTDFLGPYPVDAVVSDEQGNMLVNLLYSTNGVDYAEVDMSADDFFNYSSEIPVMTLGTTVSYYVRAEDENGNLDSTDIFQFIVTDDPPAIEVNITEITSQLTIGDTEEHLLKISNAGLLPLEFSIERLGIGTKDPVTVITDPVGDQTANSPDIVALDAELLGDTAVFMQLEFNEPIDENTMLAIIEIDVDQDMETGATGEDLFGYPGWNIGAEFAILWDFSGQFSGEPGVFVTDAELSTVLATLEYAVDGNTMSTNFSLEHIGNDDGNMNVAAICGSEQGFDAAPNEGSGTIGLPGVATWLKIDSYGGITYAGDSAEVMITLDATNVNYGVYSAEIHIESNDPLNEMVVIPVTLTVVSDANDFLTYSIPEQIYTADVNSSEHTIDVVVAVGTDLTNLVAEFTLSGGATAAVNSVDQESGVTPNDFTNPVVYNVTAQDGVTVENWTVTVEDNEGIKQIEAGELKVYPNPTKHKLFIEGAENSNITICNMLGEKIMQIEKATHNQAVNVSKLQNGMYIIKIDNEQASSKIFVVNN